MMGLQPLARRSTACLASGAALVVALATPAAATYVDLKAPTIVCSSGSPYLAIHVTVAATPSGFGATATAVHCNATAIQTVIAMQAVGAGASTSPIGGGPILFAPFAANSGSVATVSAYVAIPSSTAQSVTINVTAAGVAVLAAPTNSCQFVYDRVLGTGVGINGCTVGVSVD